MKLKISVWQQRFGHKDRNPLYLSKPNADPTLNRVFAGEARSAPESAAFGSALLTSAWEIKYAVREAIQKVNAVLQRSHCAFEIDAALRDTQYSADICVAVEALVVAMEGIAVRVNTRAVDQNVASEIIDVAVETAVTGTLRPVVMVVDALIHAPPRWMPWDVTHRLGLFVQLIPNAGDSREICPLDFTAFCDVTRETTPLLLKTPLLQKLFGLTSTAEVGITTDHSISQFQPP